MDEATLGAPSPAPRQVFGIGLNYASHAAESGMELPSVPAVFTKYPASLGGPFDPVELSGELVDWEVELVVVMGHRTDRVAETAAWAQVAGLCVGQDISDRQVQFAAGGQFSLGKSYRTYGPTGPWLVTPDELDDPDDIGLGCSLDGEVVQQDRTSGLVFSVPAPHRRALGRGAPAPGRPDLHRHAGRGGHQPQAPAVPAAGQVLESWIDGIGTIRNAVVAPTDPAAP